MIAAYFLKSHGPEKHGDNWMMDRYLGLLKWSLARNAPEVPSEKRWKRMFAWLRDHRWWTVGGAIIAFALTIFGFATLEFTGQPTTNTDYSQVRIEMPPGTTLKQTERVADQVSAVLRSAPEVAAAFADINVAEGNVYITLKKDREKTSVEFERSMAPKLRAISDARVSFQSQNSGLGRDVTIMLGGSDPDKLYAAATRLVSEMNALPQLRAARIDGDLKRPEIVIKPQT